MMRHREGWREPYDQSMALCRYIKDAGTSCNPKSVEEMWHRTFCCAARELGFNRATRRILWEELVGGNWARLHRTIEEDDYSVERWLKLLRDDVFYCSDRWSLDRLTRCHWLFRRYMDATRRDQGEVF